MESVAHLLPTQMAQIFLVALETNQIMPLLVYSYLDDIRENHPFALELSSIPHGKQLSAISKRESQMQERLNVRTKGLPEVTEMAEISTWDEFFNSKLDFLHRIVGEFSNKKEDKTRFVQAAGPTFHPRVSLTHAFLATIKLTFTLYNYSSGLVFRGLAHELLGCAYVTEVETKLAQIELLDGS